LEKEFVRTHLVKLEELALSQLVVKIMFWRSLREVLRWASEHLRGTPLMYNKKFILDYLMTKQIFKIFPCAKNKNAIPTKLRKLERLA
jgi:hypothetical protein